MPSRPHAALPASRRASARRRHTAPKRRISRLLAWLLAAWLGSAGWAMAQVAPTALPTGAQVRVGAGTLSQTGNLLVIQQSTERLGLDWQSFNIGSAATVEFRQPGASSVALNRVLGNDPSRIYGQLKANGQVFLTNPNGVLFAPSARVDVGGLVASALDLSQQDFADGRLQFNATGVNGSVVNQGQLRASAGGYLALFGQKVSNEGDISVDAGSVVLAAGRAATVSISGNGLLSAVVAAGTVPGQVDNAGRIAADGGVVTLTAKSAQDIAASLVNNSGIVRANALVERGGEIWITGDLVQTSGTLAAAAPAGGDAGRIMVLGDMQRGEVNVAGTLDVSARQGRGGFVETSAARVSVASGARYTALAPNGQTGTWLIDPNDYTVGPAGNQTGEQLGLALQGGNVQISTATQGTAGGNGDIFIAEGVTWGANKLTLTAERHIVISAPLSGGGVNSTASLALEYGQGASGVGTYTVGAPVSLPAGNNFSTKASTAATVNYTVVTTLAGLRAIDSALTGNYVLGADIDASTQVFTPLGNENSTTTSVANSFSGRFDGLGHSLTGLAPASTVANGLFASLLNADVRNLTIVGGSFTGTNAVGALAGTTAGSTSITNVTSSATVTAAANAVTTVATGGLLGEANGTGSITGSSSTGDVTGRGSSGSTGGLAGEFAMSGGQSGNSASGTVAGVGYVGGLFGWYNSSVALTSGSFTGPSVTGTTYVGGLVGYMNSTAAITGPSAQNPLTVGTTVTATGSGGSAGGLVGRANGAISNARATGNVTGVSDVGGLVGTANGAGGLTDVSATGNVQGTAASGNIGGLVGFTNNTGALTRGTASGNVGGGFETGGLVGYYSTNANLVSGSASGNVTITSNGDVGGLVGYATGTGSISNSSATGNVQAPATADSVGGLVGEFRLGAGLVNSSAGSANSTVAGGNYTGGVIGWSNSNAPVTSDVPGNSVVSFRGAAVSGGLWVGGIFGQSTGTGALTGLSASATVTATGSAGGVAGLTSSDVINATATGNVTGRTQVGGLIGQAAGTATTITNGQASGTVSNTTTASTAGGLVGYASGAGFSGGQASGSVSGGSYAGGFVGYLDSGRNITGATASGNVSGAPSAGGLAGYTSGAGNISGSSASGNVTGSAANSGSVGGLVGEFRMAGGITGSSAGGNVSGGANTGGLAGLTATVGAIDSVTVGASTVSGGTWVGGLIGNASSTGTITGVTVNVTVQSANHAGGLVGFAGGAVSGSTANGNVSGTGYVGGLVGQAAAAITGGSATGAVSGGSHVGGLVGYQSAGTVSGGNAAGNVTTNAVSAYAGGLVGYAGGTGAVSNSTASGNVSAGTNARSAGGLVGEAVLTGGIVNSRSGGTGSTVAGGTHTGGVVGYYGSATALVTDAAQSLEVAFRGASVSGTSYAGGIVGYSASSAALQGLSASATVTATGNAGGVAGRSGGAVTASSASGNVSGTGSVGGLIGLAEGTGNITDGTANGSVSNSAINGNTGGLIGLATSGSVVRGTATGNVSGGRYVGGLIGQFGNNAGGGIQNGSASGSVTSDGDAGGLVGYAAGNGSISNGLATGSVTSNAVNAYSAGGVAGYFGMSGGISATEGRGNVGGTAANAGGAIGYYDVAAPITTLTTLAGSVTGNSWVGGLIGYMTQASSITGPSAQSPLTVSANVTSAAHAGGLVGRSFGSITNARATGNVTGTTAGDYVGGLVGQAVGTGTLTDVSAAGNVTAGGALGSGGQTGGLVGYAVGPGVLRGSATGVVSANGGDVGGLVGQFASGADIRNSQADGNVSSAGSGNVGGLVGYSNGSGGIFDSKAFGRATNNTTSGTVGGLVGYFTASGGMARVEASGIVSGGDSTGGLVGYYSSNGTMANAAAKGLSVSGNSAGQVGGLVGQSGQLVATDVSSVAVVTGGSYTGGLLGYGGGTGSITRGSATGSVTGSTYVGGLAGWLDGYDLTNATAGGRVVAISGSTVYAGGLVGRLGWSGYSGRQVVTNSQATGDVVVDAPSAYVGGLIGQHFYGSVSGGIASGRVTATDSLNSNTSTFYTGGLIGYFAGGTFITGSSASGAVAGRFYTGGLVGFFSGTEITGSQTTNSVSGTDFAGGLVGRFSGTRIANSSASGAVSGNSYVGGLAGRTDASTGLSAVSATGNVTAAANAGYVGGLVGYLATTGITTGFASGNVSAGAGSQYTGGLVGYANPAGANATGMAIDDSRATGSVSGAQTVGGLVGYYVSSAAAGGITNSRATGNVTGNTYVGGLVGQFVGTSAAQQDIRGSFATGNVSGTNYVGGLVADFSGAKGIASSYATGSVTGRGNSSNSSIYLGGLAGQYYFNGSPSGASGLNQSYATGSVTQNAITVSNFTDVFAGGLVGSVYSNVTTNVAVSDAYATGAVSVTATGGRLRAGGLVGHAAASIARGYATGAVSMTGGAQRFIGGLLGQAANAQVVVSDAYWNTTTSGQATSARGTGLTSQQMQDPASFTGWSLATDGTGGRTWRIYAGQTDPLLSTFLTPLTLTLANASKVYDGTTSFGNASLTAASGQPVGFPERIFTTAPSPDVGSYDIGAAGVYSVQTGYDLTVTGNATLTVTPRPLTLTGLVANKTYDGTRNATVVGTGQPAGLVAGEDLLVNLDSVTAQFDTKTVGQNKTVTVSGYALGDGVRGKASNYSLANATQTTASITPATLTAGGFTATNRVYDGTNVVAVSAAGGTVTGAFGNDDVNVDVSSVNSGTMADKNAGNNKAVTVSGIQLTGADAINYVVGGASGVTVNITPKTLTVNSLTAVNRQYDGGRDVQVNTGSAVLSGLVSGDIVSVQQNALGGTMADKNVGTAKPVTIAGVGLRGPDAANYTGAAGPVTVNITQAPIYLYVTRNGSTDRVYNGTAAANVNVQLLNLYGNDNVTLTYDAPTYSDKNVAYNNAGNPTSKTITVANAAIGGADVGNYTFNTTTYGNTTSGTITPKPLAVTGVSAVNRAYDGTRNITVNVAGATVDSSGVIVGDDVTPSVPSSGTVIGTVASKNVGNNLPVTIPGFGLAGADRGNYTLTGTNGVRVTITPKDLTATYTGRDRVYDGQTWAGVVSSSTDIVAGDDVRFYANEYAPNYFFNSAPGVFTGTGAKDVGTAKPVRVVYDYLIGNDANNYNYLNRNFAGGYGTTTANLTPKPLANLVFTGTSRVYDGGTAATVTLNKSGSGIVGSDVVTTSQTAAFVDKNVGNGKLINISGVTLGGADAANYTVAAISATATANITPKSVTFSGLTASNRAYDGTTAVAVNASGVTSSGFVTGDDVSVAQPPGGLNSGTIANKNVGTGKIVTVTGLTLAGTDAGNYTIDAAASGLTVDITPRPLTAVYTGGSRAYNGGVGAPVTVASPDYVAGDDLTYTQSAVFTGLNARDVGTNKPISVTGITLGGTDRNNYALTNTTATAFGDISSRVVNISYTSAGRVYNGLADRSITVSGLTSDFVPGDVVGFSQSALLRGDGAAGDARVVDISGITLSGAQAANYTLAATTATTTANIAKRPIGVSGISAVDRGYDGTTAVSITVGNATVNTSSIIAGDDVSVIVPPSGISSGTMLNKDAGQNKAVLVTGLAVTGASADNYTATGASGITVNIAPRSLTAVYSAASKVYNGNATAQVSATSGDILAGDVGALSISASGVFAGGKNAGTGLTVNVSGGFLTGAERNNYALTNPTGTATASITPKPIAPSYSGGTRVYDGTDAAPVTSTTAGIVGGDEVAFGQTAVFSAGKNVGAGKAIAISGIVLAGADAVNYALTATTATASGTITAKPITVAGLGSVTASDRVYDGTDVVTVTIPTGVTLTPNSADIISGDQVTINVPAAGVTTGSMADKNAGSNKQVAITGLTLTGTDAGNYVVAGAAGVTVNIARKDLTAAYAGVTRSYDGGVGVSVTGTSADIVTGDNLLITGAGFFTGTGARNAGSGKSIQVTSAQLSGADRGNYTLLNTTGSAVGTVTQRLLTPGYQAYTRVYDGTTTATLTATEAGVIAGDDLQFSQTAAFTGAGAKNVGNGKNIAVSGITLSGADAPNYSLSATSTTTTGSITPRAVTLTGLSGVQAVDRTYNGTTTVTVNLQTTGTVTPTPGDILDGDTVTVNVPTGNVTTGTMANKNAGTGKAVVAIAGLGLSGADAANYTLVGTTGVTVNITPKSMNAVYAGGTRVYDGGIAAPVTASSTDILAGDAVGFGINAQFSGAGARNVGSGKAIDVLGATLTGADAVNYALVNPTGQTTGGITPKTVSVAYTGGTRIYDGTVAAPVNGSIVGLVAGDAVSASASAVFTGVGAKNVGTDKAVSVTGIQLAGADSGNYALSATSASTTATITPRPLRVQGLDGITAADRVYDGTVTVAVNVNASGPLTLNSQDVVSGDDLTLNAPPNGNTTGVMLDKNVGTNKTVTVAGLTLTGTDAGNYSIAAAGGVTVNITPRPLQASYTGVTRVYDGSVAASVIGSTADLVGGDFVSIVGSGVFTGAGAKNAGTAKPISVTTAALAGIDAQNYLLTNPTGSATGTVTQRLLTALYTGGTRVYDGSTAAPVTGSLTGLVNGDAVSLAGSATFTGPGARNVGTNKAVSVSGITLSGEDAGNYSLAANSASTTASITPRPLRVDGLTGVAATDRAYDGTNVVSVSVQASGTLTPNSADVVPGDVVTVSLPGGTASTGTLADKNVGQNKAVTVGGIELGGADGANYSVSAALGLTVNITPRLLTATWVGIDKVYDGTALAQVGGTSSDVIAGDLLTFSASGSFVAGKNAGAGKTVQVTAGLLQGADAGNYSLRNPTGTTTATILQKLITPSYTGGTRVYDGGISAPVTVGNMGLVAGDDVSLSQTASFTGAAAKNVGNGKAVSIEDIALSGSDAANYRLAGTTATTTASITPKGVSVSGLGNLSAVDRVYDGTRNVQIVASGATGSSATSTDFVTGDDVSIVVPGGGLGAGLMVDKNAGTNKAVAISGLTLSGGDAANYRITGTAGVSVNIAPRPATLLGLSAVDRVYDGTRTVAIDASGASLSGVLAGDTVLLGNVAGSGTMADKHAGTGKAVSFDALQLGGTDAANYAFTSPVLSVNIAPRPFTASITVADKVYDGTTSAAATLTTSGLVAGDQVTLAGGGNIRFADKNVGAGKTVSASGLTLAGADAGDYRLTSDTASASASITPAPLLLAFNGGAAGSSTLSKVYGETLNLAGTEFSAQGLVAGETLALVTMSSAGAAGNASVQAGGYGITLSNARGGTFDPANYTMSYGSGTLLVTPRPLTITGPLVTRYADEKNPAYFDTLSLEGLTVSAGGLVFGDTLRGAVLTSPPGSAAAQGVALFELLPAGAQFAPGVNASNYSLRYASGLLIVLPKPPRVGESESGGTSVTGVGVVVDQAELERALGELERTQRLVVTPGRPQLPLVQRAAEQAGDITVALAGDERRITLPALLKLPLLSFDPVLRRLIFGPAIDERR